MKPFDPDRSPCWEEQVEHAKTWSDTSPETLATEKRTAALRRVAVVLPVTAVVVVVCAWIWLGGA